MTDNERMFRRIAVLPCALMVLSCGEDGSGKPDCACTSAIGASECGTDADCVAIADSLVQPLMSPQVSPYHVIDSACGQASVILGTSQGPSYQGPACHCPLEGGGTLMIGPSGLPCSLPSRGGDCLWDTTAWPACDPMVADSCVATCADAEARLAADEAHVFETDVRFARCGAVYCDIVIRIDDRCYVRGPTVSPAYDCALSDDQILAAERARVAAMGGGCHC